jgi:hypothetical protein
MEVIKKLKIKFPYDSTNLLLDIYLKECKSACNRDTSTPILITTLFTISKLWNQPRCPSTGG